MSPHPLSMTTSSRAGISHANAKLPTKQHGLKVKRLLQSINNLRCDNAVIYHRGARDAVRGDTDVELEFRQESYFFYLTGVDEPGYHVIIDLRTEQVHLIPPTIDESETVWKGAPDSPTELLQQYDVDSVWSEADMPKQLEHINPDVILVLDTTDISALESCGISKTIVDTTHLRHALDEARLTKFPWEIACIRHATKVSSLAHMALWQYRPPSRKTEAQLAALFRWVCSCHGLDRQAYVPIVASGPRTATLHYTKNNKVIPSDPHALILVDAGAESHCYSSDVTRTFPASGKFSPEAKTIYNIVLKIQETVLSLLKPGVSWLDLENIAIDILCTELLRIGILVGDKTDIINRGIPYAFYYHSLGHSVGLDVHDVGGKFCVDGQKDEYRFPDRPLEANMVITIEPGLYFNDANLKIWTQYPGMEIFFNMDVLQRYRPVGGARIEDTVLITRDGCENLTTAPKFVHDIEALMASALDVAHEPRAWFAPPPVPSLPAPPTTNLITNTSASVAAKVPPYCF